MSKRSKTVKQEETKPEAESVVSETQPAASVDAEQVAQTAETAEREALKEEVEALRQRVKALEEYIRELEGKQKEYIEGWARERADFSNYKRRIEREQATLAQNITGEILKKYLLILDDMSRAMKMRPKDGEAASWADGIELIYRKLQSILDAEGIQRIPAEQEMFDPMRHEAITYEESPEHESGQIIEVLQDGYTLGDRVLRPARVRVAR
ncbi:protein GrpE [Anaerolinea thermophila UNI-1]|uniref:Protein GrpE n=1 Tax=Anaerolinea thermophila (strain DSM 14523 / JCM 11388 / NBRC 100420 / UNI-1) TaxID=926569 RepID=E8MZI4_ANATU|nr:protein GrpE [Anaerolinea thermophila UNI-1]